MSGPFDAVGRFFNQTVIPFTNDVAGVARQVPDVARHVIDVVDDVAHDVVGAARDVGEAVVDGAQDVGRAVVDEGVATVAVDIAKHNLTQVGNITKELVTRSPPDFVDWFIGPQGPGFADFTAQVPGLQGAIGDIIYKSMQNPMIAGAAGQAFGFEYVPGKDFYTTNESSLQSVTGFHDVYDKVGDLLGMDLDDKVVEFTSGGVDYRLELWKGSYGSGGAFGGEIGLYTRHTGERGPVGDWLEKNIPGYYSAAAGEDQIATTQTIYDKKTGAEYFTNTGAGADDGKHFWNLAIRTDPGVNHEDIGQRGTLELATPKLADAMCAAMVSEGIDAKVQADGVTIQYDWP